MKYVKDKDLIRKTRIEAGLSQEAAAQLVGCTTHTWQRWEYGVHRMNLFVWEKFISLLPEV